MNIEHYIDGFLLAVSRARLDDYRAMATKCVPIWKEYGAIDYVESVIDDPTCPEMRPFAEAAGAREDEIVVLSWIVYPSKEARDEANSKIMNDPRLAEFGEQCREIFDCKRMSFGGFRPIVVL